MADYRYIPLQTETIAWTAANGAELQVVIALTREETDYFGAGDWQPTRNGLRISMTPSVNGRAGNNGTLQTITGRTDGVIAAIGNVGIRAAQLEQINAALAAVKSHPEWIARDAKIAADRKVEREYESQYNAIESMMTLGGRSC